MVLCQEAFYHWPESHPVQFDNWGNCRKWLQMKAGYREIAARFPMHLPPRERNRLINILQLSLRLGEEFLWPVATPKEIVIWRPLSIAFHKMDHHDVCKLIREVEVVIEEETGISVATLMREKKEAVQ